ncbi:hypothetical protein N658DRAFT_493901 [Parathielavia hyrcaniae]|uniref:Uncharacterized protein n=1 Tax=Parathielavia hyrcaniae TaxID=113614 RepID=A0AAN6Q9Z9_9PEZI|nr:hypothetical protein N658DRAFT_493901 [Parathielavia hyrcaniae]
MERYTVDLSLPHTFPNPQEHSTILPHSTRVKIGTHRRPAQPCHFPAIGSGLSAS